MVWLGLDLFLRPKTDLSVSVFVEWLSSLTRCPAHRDSSASSGGLSEISHRQTLWGHHFREHQTGLWTVSTLPLCQLLEVKINIVFSMWISLTPGQFGVAALIFPSLLSPFKQFTLYWPVLGFLLYLVLQVSYLANVVRLGQTPEASFNQWAWDLVLRLKLHDNERRLQNAWNPMPSSPPLVPDVTDIPTMHPVLKAVKAGIPIGCFLAIEITTTGHRSVISEQNTQNFCHRGDCFVFIVKHINDVFVIVCLFSVTVWRSSAVKVSLCSRSWSSPDTLKPWFMFLTTSYLWSTLASSTCSKMNSWDTVFCLFNDEQNFGLQQDFKCH